MIQMKVKFDFNYTITNKKKKTIGGTNIKSISKEGSSNIFKETFSKHFFYSLQDSGLNKVRNMLLKVSRRNPLMTNCVIYASPDFIPINVGDSVRVRITGRM
jgi:hypothetical protein